MKQSLLVNIYMAILLDKDRNLAEYQTDKNEFLSAK